MGTELAEKGSDYLEELKQAAEAQMRRPAPPIQQAAKKQKKTGSATATDAAAAAEEAAVERVNRYSYAAADAILQGCSGFLGMCDFKRSNSATKEMTDILKQVLPGDRKLQLVKVGCNGLVVIVLGDTEQQQQQQQPPDDQQDPTTNANQSPINHHHHQQQQQQQMPSTPKVQPTAVVHEILQRITAGSLQRTRFCQRIAPIETTCLMAAPPLRAAIQQVVSNYVAAHYASSSSGGSSDGSKQTGPVQFAVLFKNRDTNTPNAKADLRAVNSQPPQQQHHHQQQQQRADIAAAAVQPVSNSERLEKSKAINIAVATVQECCKDVGGAKVNLTAPQVVLMLEVLPLTGQQQACAVSAVPGSLMVTRPKLCVKPIAAGATAGGKH